MQQFKQVRNYLMCCSYKRDMFDEFDHILKERKVPEPIFEKNNPVIEKTVKVWRLLQKTGA